jgi:signal transduction histidine kinase
MQRLVQDLEDLSRAEAGQVHLDLRPVAMGELIAAVAQRLRPQFEDKGVALHLETAPDLLLLRVDLQRMTQVLVNLLGNALQYTPAGGGSDCRGNGRQRDDDGVHQGYRHRPIARGTAARL